MRWCHFKVRIFELAGGVASLWLNEKKREIEGTVFKEDSHPLFREVLWFSANIPPILPLLTKFTPQFGLNTWTGDDEHSPLVFHCSQTDSHQKEKTHIAEKN